MKQLQAGYLTESFSRAKTIAPAPVAELGESGQSRTSEGRKPASQTQTI